ncbi:S-layer homology domain-containing protein [Lysinibacillus louembei]|uniref:S-layer homology domain-containing protein n=1 Tax=Lysinibacillus louembei TaxID=1470088 RepID=A0ABZ0S1C1_9BACI|nr:alpha/beta fold hydrolase [Lysinibacillus louembei]WPK13391.1 S-layer homology domain-containing protein [Lysinibacillus louembei]
MKKKYFAAVLAAAAIAPAIVTPTTMHAEKAIFNDINSASPYVSAIQLLYEKGAITGFSDNTFRPQDTITRQHVLVILERLIKFPTIREGTTFTDVTEQHSYYETIQNAYKAGLIDGQPDGSFNPNAPVTRAQIAKILAQAFHLQATATTSFSDVPESHWSYPYVQALSSHHITTATERFSLNEPLTRGQFALFLERLLLQSELEEDTLPTGQWAGKIDIPQSPLSVILQIEENGEAYFSVPAQGLTNYPIRAITANNNQLQITIDLTGTVMTIEGKIEEDRITASFSQNGMTFPLILTPYEPPVVTYEELVVPVENGQLKVALEMPKDVTTKVPVAIIIAGSGPTTKDGNSIAGENNSLKMLAEGLAQQGIASIRFDKRGVGDNTGLLKDEGDLRFTSYSQDVEQIIKLVEQDPRFSSVHLIGHSEGSLVGIVAAQTTKASSIISIAGAGRPIDEILLEQLSAQLPKPLLEKSAAILTQLKKGEIVADVPEDLYALFRPSVQPYLISWLSYDPAKKIAELDVPVLIIQGSNDLQITKTDAERLHTAKPDADILYFDTMNHVLKDAPADREGNLATYANPTLPLTEGLVEKISTFILK